VHVHHGTGEHYARVVRAGGRYAQLRLASPAVAARGDRVVLRDRTTLGGGVVLDPAPPRHVSPERLARLERGDPSSIVLAVLGGSTAPLTRADLMRRALLSPSELDAGLTEAARLGEWYTTHEWLDELRERVADQLARRAEQVPLDPGIPIAELLPPQPWAAAALAQLPLERRGAKAYAPGASARLGDRAAAAATLEVELAASGFTPLKADDPGLASFLEDQGRLVRLGDGFVIGAGAFAEARARLVAECEASGSITLARFRDLLGIGRRSAQIMLERFDADGVTRRVGDERVLRKRARIPSS
jgi:selenocysteine-specific elongation factor